MPCYCGIDIGASSAKLVLVDAAGRVLARSMHRSGVDYSRTAEACLTEALAAAGLGRDEVGRAVSTGYGRDNVPWAQSTMTEIACHSRGAYAHFPQAITVIDIGAQDSKMIQLDAEGRRLSFKMNRKCAAGTGAFLEEIAHRLGLDASELNELAERSTEEVTLGSFCTVFAATEILEKIRAGKHVEDIVRGAFSSVVKRILEMDCPQGQLVMTGGVVAHNPLLARMMGESFGQPVHIPPEPQFIGALGAALFALEKT
jgi:predicted CoA-substrate-specific enzyme activase